MRLAVLCILSHLVACKSNPSGYSLNDRKANHHGVAVELANAGRDAESVDSFRAACRFSPSASAYENLGVALMRMRDFGASYLALTKASKMSGDEAEKRHVKGNMKELVDYAMQKGISKKELQQMAKTAELGVERVGSDQAGMEKVGSEQGSVSRGKANDNVLTDAVSIALRGQELINQGEKLLGRGFLSLALHMNPWLYRELPWLASLLKGEKFDYWKGNIFVGHDKTQLESILSRNVKGLGVQESAILAWRNLQVTFGSCCGVDNVAVHLSQNLAYGHPYLVPFLHLDPSRIQNMKKENQDMYAGFKAWWEGNGRPPMPEPAITYHGHWKWEWPQMRVVLTPNRTPPGWDEFVQAVLLMRLQNFEAMRASLWNALRMNEELSTVVDELLPAMSTMSALRPSQTVIPVAREKYVVQYNPAVGLGNIAVSMVSAHAIAKLLGRKLILNWNVNVVTRHAFQVVEQPMVLEADDGGYEAGVLHKNVKIIYFFHLMDTTEMAANLELLGCADIRKELAAEDIVAVSSNLYFAPFLANNPHTPQGLVPDFPDALASLLHPNPKSVKRALSFANKSRWGLDVPIVAIHIRAREPGEDNDDWPTHDAPDQEFLHILSRCVRKAVQISLEDPPEFDVFVASTTEKASLAVAKTLRERTRGVRRVLTLPKLERSRVTGSGAVDAMAEALLMSRADVFVRLVIGTAGNSNFAGLANSLRLQSEWATGMPALRPGHEKAAPNFVITGDCGSGRCFAAPGVVRMADIAFVGGKVTKRSCGDVVRTAQDVGPSENFRCKGYVAQDLHEQGDGVEEL